MGKLDSDKNAVSHGAGGGYPIWAWGGGVPIPVVFGGVDLFAGACGHVGLEGHGGAVERAVAGFHFNQPAFRGIDAGWAGRFAFNNERGAVAHLRERGINAEVPDGRGDQIGAGLEKGRQVEALVAPVGKVAASGTVADAAAVHVKDEAIIGADADDGGGRNGLQVECAPKMEYERFAQGRRRVRYPGGLPLVVRRIGGKGGLSKRSERRQGKCEYE